MPANEDNTKQVIVVEQRKNSKTTKGKAVQLGVQANKDEELVEKKRKSRRLVKAYYKEKDIQKKKDKDFVDESKRDKIQSIDATDFQNVDIESIKSYDMLCSLFKRSLVYNRLSKMDKIVIKEIFAADGATQVIM